MTAKWEAVVVLDVMRPAEVFVRSLSHEEAVRLKGLSTRAKPGHADPRGDRGERLIPADPLPRRITLPLRRRAPQRMQHPVGAPHDRRRRLALHAQRPPGWVAEVR